MSHGTKAARRDTHTRLFGALEASDHPARIEVRHRLIESAAALIAFLLEDRAGDDPRLRGRDLQLASLVTLETITALGYHNFQVAKGLTREVFHEEVARMIRSYLLTPV